MVLLFIFCNMVWCCFLYFAIWYGVTFLYFAIWYGVAFYILQYDIVLLFILCKKKLSESSLKTLRKQALQKFSESSTKAGSPKALRKLSESSQKALWKPSGNSTKALWKRAFQKLSESRLTFVGSPSKASWLSWLLLKTLPKKDDFRRKLYGGHS